MTIDPLRWRRYTDDPRKIEILLEIVTGGVLVRRRKRRREDDPAGNRRQNVAQAQSFCGAECGAPRPSPAERHHGNRGIEGNRDRTGDIQPRNIGIGTWNEFVLGDGALNTDRAPSSPGVSQARREQFANSRSGRKISGIPAEASSSYSRHHGRSTSRGAVAAT